MNVPQIKQALNGLTSEELMDLATGLDPFNRALTGLHSIEKDVIIALLLGRLALERLKVEQLTK